MRYYFRYLAAMLLLASVSCVDADLPDVSSDDNIFDTDGFSLGFTVALESISGTGTRAAWDEFDNYVDTENRFRVLFFDANGQFIFEATDRTIMPREVDGKKEWFVHIPVNYIIDYAGEVYDIEALKTQLKDNDFKIAILANWPYVDSKGNDTNIENAEPKWGLKNSILYSGTNHVQKNINDLHHLADDSNYSETEQSNSTRPSKKAVYGFVMNGDKMGVKSDWVNSRSEHNWNSVEDAEKWIKENWDPEKPHDAQYKHYKYLWYLWNFSAAYKVSGDRFSESAYLDRKFYDEASGTDIKFGWKWVRKNHYDERDASRYDPKVGYHTSDSPMTAFMQKKATSFVDNSDDAYLTFDPAKNEGAQIVDYSTDAANPKNPDYAQWGIQLYNSNKNANGTQSDKNNPRGIKLQITATGTLRILCSNRSSSNARIAVYNADNNSSSSCTPDVDFELDNNMIKAGTTKPFYVTRAISVTTDQQDYYIYCDRGEAVEIFEIEFVKAKYLYDTDREGILPSEDQPIPMYGVQDFDNLGPNWGSGSTFDLSRPRNDDTDALYPNKKSIALIRSLAKVEVYLPQSLSDGSTVSHVYMRSMNRSARCEPIDVETPTNTLWTNSEDDISNSTPGSCEWYKVQDHGPFYYFYTAPRDQNGDILNGYKDDDKDTGSNEKTQEYQEKLAWFYGSWNSAKWSDGKGWNFKGVSISKHGTDYPQLFNPSIDRSDFTHMRKVSSDMSGYDKYVLYIPEKHIDDPNYVGLPQSISKVAHVEYRYSNMDDVNLDDNNCYRIYFTNYGSGYQSNDKIGSIKKGDFDNGYELSTDNLSYHWPIMRNHRYVFVVGGTYPSRSGEAGGTPEVTSMVTTWSGEPLE